MPEGQEKFVSIADIQGWGYTNSDVRGYLAALSILQDYYPERLAKMFVVHVPYVFMAAWKMVYPFIDEKTKKKVSFVHTGGNFDPLINGSCGLRHCFENLTGPVHPTRPIVFVENKHLTSTLLKDIDESQLPDIYGGKLKLVPIQDS
ncbi:putative CRAL-TRIO lipid binding domain-containing protein [Helianthus debilis subsp. tardiflorus]